MLIIHRRGNRGSKLVRNLTKSPTAIRSSRAGEVHPSQSDDRVLSIPVDKAWVDIDQNQQGN